MFDQITEEDIITPSINNYVYDDKKNSLIEGFASTYAEKLLIHPNLRYEHYVNDEIDSKNNTFDKKNEDNLRSYDLNKNRKLYSIIPSRLNPLDYEMEMHHYNKKVNSKKPFRDQSAKFRQYIEHKKHELRKNGKDVLLDTHILYNSINATDFNSGNPFRIIAQCDWDDDILKAYNI